ncbi:MAG: transporter substrate-binding domain-containing protein [Gammaproteobacteria bacterium (ex Lamellibrachia satsuma)]|nr:MAG: transporter substrate-binding domain-containing protein [Gammaproteobacteria bacterium (ex Lamellibrachia satsuma)]
MESPTQTEPDQRNHKPVDIKQLVSLLLLFCLPLGLFAADGTSILETVTRQFSGDLDEMRTRTAIRVLVSHNRTGFFLHNGNSKGFEAELLEKYKEHLNKDSKRNQINTALVFIPVPFDQLLPALLSGKGDIAAAGLTITPGREKMVAFSKPYLPDVQEIIVAAKSAAPITSHNDLAGKTLHVLKGSSYASHLKQINHRFSKENRLPIKIIEVSEYLQTEDLLEMVNAGVVDYTVADDHIARIWSQVLKNIQLYPGHPIHSGSQLAWAVRKNNPKLLQSLDGYIGKIKKGSLLGNMMFKRYYEKTRWIKNPLEPNEHDRLNQVSSLFKKYAEQYDFDWLVVAAQAYQESGLDQRQRNPSGAIGIMQIRKATATDKHVAISDIEKLENNIHAGIKYLAWLRKHYFSDPSISPQDSVFFSLAAYNAGPAKVRKMRAKAEKMGLDRNRWFLNVEHAALRIVGQETVRYTRNIVKYYTAYRLAFDLHEATKKAKK